MNNREREGETNEGRERLDNGEVKRKDGDKIKRKQGNTKGERYNDKWKDEGEGKNR